MSPLSVMSIRAIGLRTPIVCGANNPLRMTRGRIKPYDNNINWFRLGRAKWTDVVALWSTIAFVMNLLRNVPRLNRPGRARIPVVRTRLGAFTFEHRFSVEHNYTVWCVFDKCPLFTSRLRASTISRPCEKYHPGRSRESAIFFTSFLLPRLRRFGVPCPFYGVSSTVKREWFTVERSELTERRNIRVKTLTKSCTYSQGLGRKFTLFFHSEEKFLCNFYPYVS